MLQIIARAYVAVSDLPIDFRKLTRLISNCYVKSNTLEILDLGTFLREAYGLEFFLRIIQNR